MACTQLISSSYNTPQPSFGIDNFISMSSYTKIISDVNDFIDGTKKQGEYDATVGKSYKNTYNEYPPPIPSHSRAWGANKYTTSDGRLIIEQSTFNQYRSMHAERSDGRLRLSLVTTIRHAVYDTNEAEGAEEEGVVEEEGVEEEEEVKCYDV